jgi:hypothetical protein
MRAARVSLLLAVLLCAPASTARSGLSVELSFGAAANLQTPLTVRQEGEPRIEIDARYDTRPLTSPFYYALRLGLHDQSGAWELQFVHHKLYLSNPPEEIQHFEISHGFNVLTLNRALFWRGLTLRLGAGVILAHAESTVRGRRSDVHGILGMGYTLTGPSALVGVGKEFAVTGDFFVAAEVQLIAARARVPVADGTADAPHVGLHLVLGAGYRF